MSDMELQDFESKQARKDYPVSQPDCHCRSKPRPCYECEYYYYRRKAPRLNTDCIVVESLLCSQRANIIAEINIPVLTLGGIVDVGPGGVITPPITLTPDISNIVYQFSVLKNMVVITGYLPANVTVLGIELPIQITIPFQEEIHCPGLCPQDNIQHTPFKIEATITQGLEALGVVAASILFKVILSTNVTATRPVIVKEPNLKLVADVNEDRCETSDDNG